jgi:predicted transcriptional regulator
VQRNPAGILTVRELDIMNVLWTHSPLRVHDVRARLRMHLAHTTVQTLLHTLEVKRHVKHRVIGRAHWFTPCVTRDAVARASIQFLKYRLCGGCTEQLFELLVDESAREGHHALRRVQRMVNGRGASIPGP